MSEHNLQVGLFDWVDTMINMGEIPELKTLYAIPNGGKRPGRTAVYLKREGVRAGVWDIHLPVAKDDHVGLWIEMKYKKNKLTESQQTWQDLMTTYGHKCVICYSTIDAIGEILDYLGIPRSYILE